MALINRIFTPLRQARQTQDRNDQEIWFDADCFRIRAQHVTKTFVHHGKSITALDEVSLEALDGEFLAIIGHSGAGKTTLLNILAGWEQATTGLVRIFGRDPFISPGRGADEWHAETIGYVPQKRLWIEKLSVMDTLELPLSRTAESRVQRLDRVMNVLELLRISRLARLFPAELTVSEQVKVALARAIIAEPMLLLVDQLGGSCDPDTMVEILEVLRRLNQRQTTTIIVTTCHSRVSKYAVTTKMLVDGRLKPFHAVEPGTTLVGG